MCFTTMFVYLFTTMSTILYLYLKWKSSYWKRRGVPYLEQQFFYGNAKDIVQAKKSIVDFTNNNYKQLKARGYHHGGIYIVGRPVWYPIDLELVKTILTRDFGYFMNHDPSLDYDMINKRDPILLNLFHSTDERWRKLRVKLTPTFTSGKLKMMFQTLLDTTPELIDIMKTHAAIQDPVDIKDLTSRFTTDIIGSCAFGLDCNSLKNPGSEFRQYGDRLSQPHQRRFFRSLFRYMPESIKRKYGPKAFDQEVEDFFRNIIEETIKYRESNNIYRKDFIHLLIQLKNRGKVTEDGSIKNTTEENVKPEESLTMNEVLANSVIFFLAGFETSATTMTFALLEMALNQEVQEKLRKEIKSVVEKHNGKITYDAVMEMKYLDMIIDETLRKHPPLAITFRHCNKDYRVPDSDVIIKRGTSVHIPIYGIQHDPEYYPDPEKFDPERFTEENKRKRPGYTFLAFGEGPRLCIGARFGRMQTKVGLISIIDNFKITLNEKTKTPIKYAMKVHFTAVDGGVWLNVNKLE